MGRWVGGGGFRHAQADGQGDFGSWASEKKARVLCGWHGQISQCGERGGRWV